MSATAVHPTLYKNASSKAWAWKFTLLRYRSLSQVASLRTAFKRSRDCVYFWPPFEETNQVELEEVRAKARYYLNRLNISLCWFEKHQAALIKYRTCVEDGRVIEQRQVDAASAARDIRRARYRVLWHYHGRPKGGSLTPHLYYVAEGREFTGITDWFRLISDIYLAGHSIPQRKIQFPNVPLDSCAVLGSGPSLDRFVNESDRWGGWIAANRVICDERIRRAGKPVAFCVLDPYAFSSGDSFKTMWDAAFSLLRETPAFIATTFDYAPFIELNFPEDIKAKCLYVKTLGHDSYRISTRFSLSELTVTPYGNVLSDLMLPLASSLSLKIILYGCDGAPPDALESDFPKSEQCQTYYDQPVEALPEHLDKDYFRNYFLTLNMYTRYVVDECQKQGVAIILRSPSSNTGLSQLPVWDGESQALWSSI
jgi:hypothetical protein